MAPPDYLNPFVLPIHARRADRHGAVDLYLPDETGPRPAVVFVHGPVSAGVRPTPRNWPIFRGYGSLAALRGVVGVTVDHRLHDPAGYPPAADDVAEAVELARADPRVDADRLAIWAFSGGAALLADWLRAPPGWLRCVAATYPLPDPLPGAADESRFRLAEAVAGAGSLPVVVTRVGRERPEVAAAVEKFVAAARECGARLEIIDVPSGRHGFDVLDHTEESRTAVERAVDVVLAALT